MSEVDGESFEDLSGERPHVRGVLHRAPRGGDGLVLTHGAGSSASHPLLVALAIAFADAGITVLRCDLPFRQARPHGPPFPAGAGTDREGLRRAVRALRARVDGRIFLGGHSYGGRQATMVAAESPDVAAALVALSYPLHPPRRRSELRTAHFGALQTPTMFIHGSRDPFGTPDEMRAALALIPARTELVILDGAGHDMKTRGAPSAPHAIVRAFLDWVPSATASA